MRFKFSALVLICVLTDCLSAQNNVEYKIFRYRNDTISSEGNLVGGKPNGWWKTYYENGRLKSEGNRTDFELDGPWVFFAENGDTSLLINYKAGKKHGQTKIFSPDGVICESFKNGLKTDFTFEYDNKHRLIKQIPFEDGRENGTGYVFDTLGRIIETRQYKTGTLVAREIINRVDFEGNRNGMWKEFYDDYSLHSEGFYVHGLKNGIFKEYDHQGNIRSITKYENGVEIDVKNEVSPLKYRRDYYQNGQMKSEVTYRDGKMEGIRRDFDENGNVVKSYVYSNGILVSEGILLDSGLKEGFWKEYYSDGKLKSEGSYESDNKVGTWKYYYKNQVVEQTGNYNKKGQLHGKWFWYYPDSKIMREENYKRGKLDGVYVEYDSKGRIVEQGEYYEGRKNGFWTEVQGTIKSQGEYSSGNRNGQWKSVYDNGKTAFSGSYIDGNANGEHRYYYSDGTLRASISYMMGTRHGEYRKYLPDGTLFSSIIYENGIEKSYDGVPVDDE